MKITQKITGYKVKTKELALEATKEATHTVLDRPEQITGKTYKIKPVCIPCALYITINDITVDGVTRPYEIFINCKHTDSFQWIMIFTRLVSAIFRNGGSYTFIIDEMKAIFDPHGGYFKKGAGFMPSLVADIGSVIEQHVQGLQST